MSAIKFSKQYVSPNPDEIDYWIDLSANQYGGKWKYFNGISWIDLINPDGTSIDANDYYTKLQINQMLANKASVESVESKVDDSEIAEVIKNIEFKDRGTDGIDMVVFKFNGTNVGITLPVASNTTSGIITKETFKKLVNTTQLQELYTEMYDKLSQVYSGYQKKLKAGDNIVITDNNVIHATSKIGMDWDSITGKPELYDKGQVDTMMSGVYKIKGSRAFEELPTEGNNVGDTYNITNSFTLDGEEYELGTNVVWTEEGWDALAGIFDTSELEEDIQEVKDNYLPLSAGPNKPLNGALYINGYGSSIFVQDTNETHSNIVYTGLNKNLIFGSPSWNNLFLETNSNRIQRLTNGVRYKIWDEGNDGEGSGLDADTLDGRHYNQFMYVTPYSDSVNFNNAKGNTVIGYSGKESPINNDIRYCNILQWTADPNVTPDTNSGINWVSQLWAQTQDMHLMYRRRVNGAAWSDLKTIAFTDSNVTSATKLKTPVKLWGNNFDGSGDVNGKITINGKTSRNFDPLISAYDNSLTPEIHTSINLGFDSKNKNYTWLGFYYYGDLSENNAAKFGIGGGPDVITVTGKGNVGIGVDDPWHKLEVNGSVKIMSDVYMPNNCAIHQKDLKGNDIKTLYTSPYGTLTLGHGHAANGYVTAICGELLLFNYGSSSIEGMRISNNGNVGIGTTDPQSKLNIYNGQLKIETQNDVDTRPIGNNVGPNIILEAKDSAWLGMGGEIQFKNKDNLNAIIKGEYSTYKTIDGVFNLYGSLNFYTRDYNTQELTNRLIINHSGNVGIGTTDPLFALDINGSIRLLKKDGSGFLFDGFNQNIMSNFGNGNIYIGYGVAQNGNNTVIDGNKLLLRTGTLHTDSMMINEHGNVTIGNLDLAGVNCKLYVAGYSHITNGVVINNNNAYHILDNTGTTCNLISLNSDNLLVFGYGSATKGYTTYVDGNKLEFRYGTDHLTGMVINNKGFVTIGNYDYTGTNHLLYVNGSGYFKSGIYIPNNTGIYMYDNSGTSVNVAHINSDNLMVFGYGSTIKGYGSAIYGKKIFFGYGESPKVGMTINESGNLTIGESDLAGTNYKLYVDGRSMFSGETRITGSTAIIRMINADNISYILAGSITDNVINELGTLRITGYQNNTLNNIQLLAHATVITGNVNVNKNLSVNNQITSGDLVDWYGVSWSEDSSDPTCTRIGNMALHRSLPILSAMKGYIIGMVEDTNINTGMIIPLSDNWNNAKYSLLNNNETTLQSSWKNNVMVKIPEFWYIDDYEPSTKTHNLKISQTAKAGWCHHKEAYVGAYEGYDDGTYYRSQKGQIPTVSKTREQLRTNARANGYEDEYKWNIYTYEEHRAICHLFLVEYATRNSQAPVNTALTADGFKQGGLGSGCTTELMNDTYSFIPTGTTDSLGNGSGQVAYTASNGTTYYANRYRGIENPFGHIWKHVDDVINIYDANSTCKTVYKCEKPEHFATNKNAKYKPLCSFPSGSKMQGWSKEIKATINCDFFKYSVDGSESTYWCDYNYDNDDTSEHCLLIGGYSANGSWSGLFYFHLADSVGRSYINLGSRLTYLPWAE